MYIQRYHKTASKSPTHDVFSKLQTLLRSIVQQNAPVTELVSTPSQFVFPVSPSCVVHEGELYTPRFSYDSSPLLTTSGGYEFRINTLDMTSPINPVSHCLSQNVVHVYRGISLDTVDVLVNNVIGNVFSNFTYTTCGESLTHVERNPICPKYNIDNNMTIDSGSCTDTIKIEPVPAFIEDLPDGFWSEYPPDCVISHNEDKQEEDKKNKIEDGEMDGEKKSLDEKIVYQTVSYHDYLLTKREKVFFDSDVCHDDNSTLLTVKKMNTRRVIIKGLSVMTIWYCGDSGNDGMMMVFHMDKILSACYNVRDIRMLYTEDSIFHQQLTREIVSFFLFFYLFV